MHRTSKAENRQNSLMILWQDRTVITMVLSLLLILVMGMLRPDKPLGLYQQKYWAQKIQWQHCADVVLTGDSRVLAGLSPVEMQKTLVDRRIVNYAFGSNWYSTEYLQASENVLDPKSHKKTIIMGISPHSLTQRGGKSAHFFELREFSKQQIFMDIHFAAVKQFLEPMSFRDAFHGLFPSLAPTHTRKEFLVDGWIAIHKTPKGEKRELKRYRKIYEDHQVSEQTIAYVTTFVSEWTRSGITVYGFLLPTCSEMVELEKNFSGFEKGQFIDAFKTAGGLWIETDQCKYYSFDGSHLQDGAALEFSRDIAKRIYDIEQSKN